MKELFDKVSLKCSKLATTNYSTSFSLGIRCLSKELRDPICAIYGFVRFAD
ncbi:MAG: phytoene/squalene synthase family protein, partial [Bacteroidota bacterium]